MADGAIGTTQIADGSITAAKISGGTGVWVGNGANIYHDAGNVGIGTTAPNLKLQVNGSLGARGPTATDGYIDMQPGSTTYAGYLEFFKPGPSRLAYLGYAAGGINNLGLNLESAAFNINGGNVGIGLGAADPAATLDVNGSLKVSGLIAASGGITTGSGNSAMPGLTPIIVEGKTPNNQTLWDRHEINVSAFADRPGGFEIRIYAQHELAAGGYDVKIYEGTMVFEQAGYANNPDFTTAPTLTQCSFIMNGVAGTMTMGLFGRNNNCSQAQACAFPDGWVEITNYAPNTATGGCGGGDTYVYTDPTKSIFVTFHPHVSGRIVISDN